MPTAATGEDDGVSLSLLKLEQGDPSDISTYDETCIERIIYTHQQAQTVISMQKAQRVRPQGQVRW